MNSTVDLGDYKPVRRDNRLEQLTDVRNHVRRELKIHPGADSASVVVEWNEGEVEDLVFDRNVGYPVGTSGKEWYNNWKEEVRK